MTRVVPDEQLDHDLFLILDLVRGQNPGVSAHVHSPTSEEVELGDASVGYREVVVGSDGPVGYAIPLVDGGEFEVWRVGVSDMPGDGEIQSRYPDLFNAVRAAADYVGQDRAADLALQEAAGQSTARRVPSVPWEIASWSPRVRAMCAQALWGAGSLNTMVGVGGVQAVQDRGDLHAAFDQMSTGLLRYVPAAYAAEPVSPLAGAVLDARTSLANGDLDATLKHLTAADQLRRGTDLPDASAPETTAAALRAVIEDASRRARLPGRAAVSNVWRSDATAAAEISAQADELTGADADAGIIASSEDAAASLRAEEVELVARVDPARADTIRTQGHAPGGQAFGGQAPGGQVVGRRVAWDHRRPERVPEQPDPDRDRPL